MDIIKDHKYIDTMMFEVGATYYIKDCEDREALIVCTSRTSEKAEFMRIFDISGNWSKIYNTLIIDCIYTPADDYIRIRRAFFNDVFDPCYLSHKITINIE